MSAPREGEPSPSWPPYLCLASPAALFLPFTAAGVLWASILRLESPFGLATAEVYRGVEVPAMPLDGTAIRAALAAGDVDEVGRQLHNRLQAPAERLRPELTTWLDKLAGDRPLARGQCDGAGRLRRVDGVEPERESLRAGRGRVARRSLLSRRRREGRTRLIAAAGRERSNREQRDGAPGRGFAPCTWHTGAGYWRRTRFDPGPPLAACLGEGSPAGTARPGGVWSG